MSSEPASYRDLGEAAWRWVLGQVRWDDGPWIPVTGGADALPEDRDEMHSGVAGLAYVLAEVRLARPWTEEERTLADGITDRLRRAVATTTDPTFFVGLPSALGGLRALGLNAPEATARLRDLGTADGWPQHLVGPPGLREGAPLNDLTLGTGGVLAAALWAADDVLAHQSAEVLLRRATPTPTGLTWTIDADADRLVPRRSEMPNLAHGTAGVAAVLAGAGHVLGRADLLAAATRGAEHVVALADGRFEGLAVPHLVPVPDDHDEEDVAWGWCHGPTGTSLLFAALETAGVLDVAGRTPAHWYRESLRAVRASGIPERLRPGFWDNDGRCCGTAGVADTFLDSWQRNGHDEDRAFAVVLGDALLERAIIDHDLACWRFVEHRAADPLLPPGVGWFQGAAGIAAVLLRLGRLLEQGREAPAVGRMENWWALPDGVSSLPRPPG